MQLITNFQAIFLFVCSIILPLSNLRAEDLSQPLKIGSILILSGEGSATGIASQRGIDMAVEDINREGGVLGRSMKVIHQDDRGDAKTSLSAFQQLVDVERVNYIIGPTWSHQGTALMKPAHNRKIVMISPSLGISEFNESSPFLFNTWPHDYVSTEALADYVYSKGHRKVALVGAEQNWVKQQTESFTKRFKELGGQIVISIEPPPGTTSLASEALKIKKSGVDAVVSTTDGIVIGSLVAKELKVLQAKFPLYSINLDQVAIDAAQGGFEGLEFMSFLTPTAAFKKRYEDRFKEPIEVGADSAYDAVILLAKAIQAVGSDDNQKVAEHLASIKAYEGMSGTLHSDGHRGYTKPFILRKVVHGVPQTIELH